MKRILMVITILVSTVSLTACQFGGNHASGNQSRPSAQVLGRVDGQSYHGTHTGNGTATDPTYRYKISFGKDGHFGQEIVSSHGYAARFIHQGTYRYDAKAKTIKLNITKVTETSYGSNSDLQASHEPIQLSVRTTSGKNATTRLTKAEDHPLTIKDKGSYLLGTVNNVHLVKDANPINDYDKLSKTEQDAYSQSGQVINQKTFYAKLGTSRIWITFNGDGTWTCRIIDGTHKWDIYDQGTWVIKNGKLSVTPTGDIREYTIVGDTTDPQRYSGVTTNSSRVTDNFIWKITGDQLTITSKQDSSMTAVMREQTTATKSFNAAQNKTTKADKNLSTNPFNSQSAFEKWLNANLPTTIDSVTIADVSDYQNVFRDNFYGVHIVYVVTVTSNNPGAPTVIVLGSDGNCYELVQGSWRTADTLTAQLPMVKTTTTTTSTDETNSADNDPFNSNAAFIKWVNENSDYDVKAGDENTPEYGGFGGVRIIFMSQYNRLKLRYWGLVKAQDKSEKERPICFASNGIIYMEQDGAWYQERDLTKKLPLTDDIKKTDSKLPERSASVFKSASEFGTWLEKAHLVRGNYTVKSMVPNRHIKTEFTKNGGGGTIEAMRSAEFYAYLPGKSKPNEYIYSNDGDIYVYKAEYAVDNLVWQYDDQLTKQLPLK